MTFAGQSRAVGLSMDTDSCHLSGAKNLKVGLKILGKFCALLASILHGTTFDGLVLASYLTLAGSAT